MLPYQYSSAVFTKVINPHFVAKKKKNLLNLKLCLKIINCVLKLNLNRCKWFNVCSDLQPHPPTFFRHMEILVPEVESYLEGFMCEISCVKSVQFKRNQQKTLLGNYINIVFSNCLQWDTYLQFFTMDDTVVRNVTISASLRKIHFSKISE